MNPMYVQVLGIQTKNVITFLIQTYKHICIRISGTLIQQNISQHERNYANVVDGRNILWIRSRDSTYRFAGRKRIWRPGLKE